MSLTTLLPGVRRHPSGPGYQVRIVPFPAKTLDTVSEANEYATELRRRKRQGILVPPADTSNAYTTLAEATNDHLHQLATVGGKRRRRYSEAGMRKARQAARPWLDENGFGATPLAGLEVRKVRRYLEERAAAHPRAAAGEWHALRGTLVLAELDGEEFDRKLYGIGERIQRAEPAKRHAYNADEIAYLASFAPEHLRRLFPLGRTLGMRIGELLQAEVSWVDLKAGTLTIPAAVTKSRKERRIKLTKPEAKLLREQLVARGGPSELLFPRLHGTPWSHANFWHKVVVKARRRAAAAYRAEHGLADNAPTPYEWPLLDGDGNPLLDSKGKPRFGGFAPHDLRRAAATTWLENTTPDLAAHRLGHKDAGYLLVKRYATVRDERLDAEIDRIEAAGGLR